MKNKTSKEMALLADYLRRVRSDLGLSMHEVARRTSLTASYISKIENGATFQTISAHALVEFSKCYGIPPSIILEQGGFTPQKEDDLPGLASFLRLKYKAPHQAVQEMEIAWEITKKKYQIQ
ncbi:MAG: helix-turn-helix domain-containing protein [Candidatus Spechtbacteria bacterium]|nr:helix-turn-helix domain-containing protein [Candidatus Spechtbacteria bacterium]